MVQGIFEQFVTLWVVIDPIGTIPVFVAVTAGIEASKRSRVALHAALVATGVLIFFLVAGQFLIDALRISLPAFQIAGGLILFLFALTMIFGDSKPQAEAKGVENGPQQDSPAIFPLAVPSLASPGAMLAVVLLTDNNRFSITEQAVTAGLMLSVIAVAFLLMLAAGPILKVIRVSGAAVVSRVMGMILAAVAVDNVIVAIIELIETTEI
jgi:multiple antibiotic resistance protein